MIPEAVRAEQFDVMSDLQPLVCRMMRDGALGARAYLGARHFLEWLETGRMHKGDSTRASRVAFAVEMEKLGTSQLDQLRLAWWALDYTTPPNDLLLTDADFEIDTSELDDLAAPLQTVHTVVAACYCGRMYGTIIWSLNAEPVDLLREAQDLVHRFCCPDGFVVTGRPRLVHTEKIGRKIDPRVYVFIGNQIGSFGYSTLGPSLIFNEE